LLVISIISCSAGIPVQQESQRVEDDSLAVHYSILFIIHGDGNYLYHDTAGNEYIADEEALADAKKVAGKITPRCSSFTKNPRVTSCSFSHFGMKNSITTRMDSLSRMNCIGVIRRYQI
jgi:hypothetical protein